MSDQPTNPQCPKCGSKNYECYDESNEWFEDRETGEAYEAPVGYMKCRDCGYGFISHWCAPDKYIGDDRRMFGRNDSLLWD